MHHSWVITAEVSIGDLSKQLCMSNCLKALAEELLIKIQQQLLASNFMFRTLLGEFSNIGNIYQPCEPIVQTVIQLLRNEQDMNKSITSDKHNRKKPLTFLGRCTSLVNRDDYKGCNRNKAVS